MTSSDCPGHEPDPAGDDPMGTSVYCDGSCVVRRCADCDAALAAEDVAANADDAEELTGGLACRRCMAQAAGIGEVAEARAAGRAYDGSTYPDDLEDVEDVDGTPVDPAYDAHMAALAATPMPYSMSIDVIRGTEGPSHDPWGFTLYRVHMPWGVRINYRSGMSESLYVDGVEVARGHGEPAVALRFEALVGFDCDQLEWWFDRTR